MSLTIEFRKQFDSYLERAFVDSDENPLERDDARVETMFQNAHRVVVFIGKQPRILSVYSDYTTVMLYGNDTIFLAVSDDSGTRVFLKQRDKNGDKLCLNHIQEIPPDLLTKIRES